MVHDADSSSVKGYNQQSLTLRLMFGGGGVRKRYFNETEPSAGCYEVVNQVYNISY